MEGMPVWGRGGWETNGVGKRYNARHRWKVAEGQEEEIHHCMACKNQQLEQHGI